MADDQDPVWDALNIAPPAANLPSKGLIREVYRTLALPRMRDIVEGQIAKAVGVSHFMLRDPESGQWRRLTDPDEIQAALNHPNAAHGSTYFIHTKDPDVPAITDILNRCMDKPKEQEQTVDVNAKLEMSWKETEE